MNVNIDDSIALSSIIVKASKWSKTLYVLDSGASVHIFRENIIKDTSKRNLSQIRIKGVGGVNLSAKEEGKHDQIGRYLVVPEATANLLSVSELTKHGLNVHFIDNNAVVETADTQHIFKRSADGMYYIKLQELMEIIKELTESDIQHSYTISIEREDGFSDPSIEKKSYTQKQKIRASNVHRLHYMLGHPSNTSLAQALKHGCIINTPLTHEDVSLYEEIYGECPHCVAGKIKKPSYTSSESFPVSEVGGRVHFDLKSFTEQQVDGGFLFYLLSVDEFSGYLHASPIKSKRSEDVISGLKVVFAWYKSNNHTIKEIMCDSESTFKSIEVQIGLMGILSHFTPPYQHAQRIERYINSRMRSIMQALPYVLPTSLHGELILEVINHINFMPNSLHPQSTPSILFSKQKFDLRTYQKPAFGTPAMFHQVHEDKEKKIALN